MTDVRDSDLDRMRHDARYFHAGVLNQQFDDAMHCISRLAVSDIIDKESHDAINPQLDDMIRTLNDMRNNVLTTYLYDDAPKKDVKE